MTGIEVGPAREADYEWCATMMAATDPWITLGRRFEDCLARLRHAEYTLLIARREDQPRGFVLLHPRGLAGSPYIASIAVAAEARGQGVGSLLLDCAERHWGEARHIFLCVSSFNTAARRLYERSGYEVVGEFRDYVIEGASEILMCKRLVRR
jgi:ribosomal protein S18 acetylase RimI-like enzyme